MSKLSSEESRSAPFFFFNFQPHPMAYGILAPQPGTKPTPSGLEGRVLTAAPRGKSQLAPFFISLWILPLIFCSQWGQSIHDGQERSRVMVTVPSCVHVCGSIGGLYTEHRCPYLPSSIYLFLPSSYDESHSVQNDCSKNWGVLSESFGACSTNDCWIN